MSDAEFKVQAKQKVMQLGSSLKQHLQQAVKKGGLPNGAPVCKDSAPTITAELSTDCWQVGRTALKVRNPENTADSWEKSSLQVMLKGLEQGVKPDDLMRI